MSMRNAVVAIEVLAGLIPPQAMPEYTKRWVIDADQWSAAKAEGRAGELLLEYSDKADEYARELRNPLTFNWVRTDWIWF